MAHLWIQQQLADVHRDAATGAWAVSPLDDAAVVLQAPQHAGAASALVMRSRLPAGELWLVMGVPPSGVLLNGEPLRTGMRVLADRDELQVDGVGRMFFSTECLARVRAFPGAERAMRCVRCKQVIQPGSAAVCCPQCATWYHHQPSDDLSCWTYVSHCAVCPQPTALETGYQWTPAEVGA